MIGSLTGFVKNKKPNMVLIEVNGIGYEVNIPLSTSFKVPAINEPTSILTHLIVREDQHTLYGFATEDERNLFRALIKISGVGPKLALTILSGMSPIELFTTIDSNDVEKLSTIPGIGSKTAARLILEMRDKMGQLALDSEITNGSISQNVLFDDALSALVNLGYKKSQAEQALKKVWPEGEPEDSIEDLIKKSLNLLS